MVDFKFLRDRILKSLNREWVRACRQDRVIVHIDVPAQKYVYEILDVSRTKVTKVIRKDRVDVQENGMVEEVFEL